jgi:hypothetical protein
MTGGRKSRDKGRRGEQVVVLLLKGKYPDAQRVGYSFVRTIVDVKFGNAVAQVKNTNIGGSKIGSILEELARSSDGQRFVIFKPASRKDWIICQTLEQFLESK